MPNYKESGSIGLSKYAGFITEEYDPTLQGRKAIDTYKKMMSDATVGSILFTIDMLIRQVEWQAEPASDEDVDVEASEFLQSCMDDMSMTWPDLISEILTMLPFGFSFHEIVYKRRLGSSNDGARNSRFNDGRIGWRKMPIRAQETLDHWKWDKDGGIEAFVQRIPPNYEEKIIPIKKGLLFRTSTHKNNPEGKSILRIAYRAWHYKNRMEEIEGVGVERDLAGLPVADVDPEILLPTATPEQIEIRNAIESIVKGIRRDTQEGILWPKAYDEQDRLLYELKLLSSGGSRQFDTGAIIDRYDKRIAMTALADFILLGQQAVGSYALSSDKTALFAVAIGAWLDVIQEVFNRFAVPRLFQLNGMELESLPKIKHGDVEKPDLAALGTFIGALTSAGIQLFPDERLEAYLRQAGGLPEKEEDGQQAPPAPTAPTSGEEEEPPTGTDL